MKTEAFPCASRYIEGNAKTRNVVTHHGSTQANNPRRRARQPETSAAIRQATRQVRPTQKGQARTQNLASAKLNELKEELRRRWHQTVAELGQWLRSVVQGYFNYHAVPGNLVSNVFGWK